MTVKMFTVQKNNNLFQIYTDILNYIFIKKILSFHKNVKHNCFNINNIKKCLQHKIEHIRMTSEI